MSLVDKKSVAILLIVLVSYSGLSQAAACVCTCCKDDPASSEESPVSAALFLNAATCQCSVTCDQGQDSPLAEQRVLTPERHDTHPPTVAQSLAPLPTPAPFAICCDSVSHSAHFNACIQARLCRLIC